MTDELLCTKKWTNRPPNPTIVYLADVWTSSNSSRASNGHCQWKCLIIRSLKIGWLFPIKLFFQFFSFHFLMFWHFSKVKPTFFSKIASWSRSLISFLNRRKKLQWNVKPLLGNFGGRAGIFSFFIEPSSPLGTPLSLHLLQFFLFFFTSTMCMHACTPKACD